jgi:hypothetical protein
MRALSSLLLAPYARTSSAAQIPSAVDSWVERIAGGHASPLEAARALLNEVPR